jgi:hypothetical protein
MKDIFWWSIIFTNIFSSLLNIYSYYRYKKIINKADELKQQSIQILRKVCSCYWDYLSPNEKIMLRSVLEKTNDN